MNKSIRRARIAQLLGALCLIVVGANIGGNFLPAGGMGLFTLLGLGLIIGGKTYEFLTRG